MRQSWKESALGDFVNLKRGYDLPIARRQAGATPIISSSGITGWHNVSKVSGPGVVTGRYGTLGQVHYIQDDFWPLNTSLYVQDFKGNNPRFVAALLSSLDFGQKSAASAVPGVNRNDLHQLRVRVPDVAHQEKIAAVLSAYDELIEKNQRRIELMEEMARLIYREWFVHFRYPDHEIDHSVNENQDLAGQSKKVCDVAEVYRGRSYRSKDISEVDGLPFVNLKCFARDGGFRRNGIKRYKGDFKSTQKVTVGDIVVAVTDMTQERRIVGQAALVPSLGSDYGVISMDLVKVQPREHKHDLYLYCTFRFSEFAEKIKHYANGANVLHLHPGHIEEYTFFAPNETIIEKFNKLVRPLIETSRSLELQNQNLAAQRDLLLPRLVSGEIDVSELDIDTSWVEERAAEAAGEA